MFGGIVSAIIKMAVISITIMLSITIFQRGSTTTSINKHFKDITNDPTAHYFSQNNEVYFAVKLIGPTPEKLFDPTYFTFQLLQNSYIKLFQINWNCIYNS